MENQWDDTGDDDEPIVITKTQQAQRDLEKFNQGLHLGGRGERFLTENPHLRGKDQAVQATVARLLAEGRLQGKPDAEQERLIDRETRKAEGMPAPISADEARVSRAMARHANLDADQMAQRLAAERDAEEED